MHRPGSSEVVRFLGVVSEEAVRVCHHSDKEGEEDQVLDCHEHDETHSHDGLLRQLFGGSCCLRPAQQQLLFPSHECTQFPNHLVVFVEFKVEGSDSSHECCFNPTDTSESNNVPQPVLRRRGHN